MDSTILALNARYGFDFTLQTFEALLRQKGLELRGFYAKGGNAFIFRVWSKEYKRELALRFEGLDMGYDLEVQGIAARAGIAPRIYWQKQVKIKDVNDIAHRMLLTLMDPIQRDLCDGKYANPAIIQQLGQVLDKKNRLGILHGDMHCNNVVILKNGALGLIDFESSRRLPPKASWILFLDGLDLIAGLIYALRTTRNRKIIQDWITWTRNYYFERFGVDIDPSRIKYFENRGTGYKVGREYLFRNDLVQLSRSQLSSIFGPIRNIATD